MKQRCSALILRSAFALLLLVHSSVVLARSSVESEALQDAVGGGGQVWKGVNKEHIESTELLNRGESKQRGIKKDKTSKTPSPIQACPPTRFVTSPQKKKGGKKNDDICVIPNPTAEPTPSPTCTPSFSPSPPPTPSPTTSPPTPSPTTSPPTQSPTTSSPTTLAPTKNKKKKGKKKNNVKKNKNKNKNKMARVLKKKDKKDKGLPTFDDCSSPAVKKSVKGKG